MPKVEKVENEEKIEKADCEIKLLRRSGSFTNDDGEIIDYQKFMISVDGADMEVSFTKDVKALVNRFVPFVEE